MVKNRFGDQVKESRSYPGIDINSDSNLVMMKCNLKYKIIIVKKKMALQQIKNLDKNTRKRYSECKNDAITEDSHEEKCTYIK